MPVVASQVSDSNFALIRMVVWLLSIAIPQTNAAYLKAISLCCPTVVPGLPPTGCAAVGSLKPTPGSLAFWITIVAGCGVPQARTLIPQNLHDDSSRLLANSLPPPCGRVLAAEKRKLRSLH